jgi:hypothetical protein
MQTQAELSPDHPQSLKRAPGLSPSPRKKWALSRGHQHEQVLLGRCFHDWKVFLSWGAEPLCLGLISGAHTAPPWGTRLGGDGASASEIQQEAI